MPLDVPRRIARRLLGNGSAPYRAANWLVGQGAVLRRSGPAHLLALARAGDQPGLLPPRPLLHPFAFRRRDVPMLINNVYRDLWCAFAPPAPRFIVDAGAYIGDTTAYYLSRFPKATVVGLEPHPTSFAAAQRNLAPYGDRCLLLNKALLDTDAGTHLSDEATGSSVGESGVAVDSITMPTLLRQCGAARIDLLKLNVEGAERRILHGNAEWLDRVDILALEIHEAADVPVIADKLARAGFAMRRFRACYYFLRAPA